LTPQERTDLFAMHLRRKFAPDDVYSILAQCIYFATLTYRGWRAGMSYDSQAERLPQLQDCGDAVSELFTEFLNSKENNENNNTGPTNTPGAPQAV